MKAPPSAGSPPLAGGRGVEKLTLKYKRLQGVTQEGAGRMEYYMDSQRHCEGLSRSTESPLKMKMTWPSAYEKNPKYLNVLYDHETHEWFIKTLLFKALSCILSILCGS
jgi:hypothetical protein